MIELGFDAGEMWLHEPSEAVELLAGIGYQAVMIRPRGGVLVPGLPTFAIQWQTCLAAIAAAGGRLVIDTQAPFARDPHQRDSTPLGQSGRSRHERPAANAEPNEPDSTFAWINGWIRELAASRTQLSERPIVVISSGPANHPDGREWAWEGLAEAVIGLDEAAGAADVTLALRPAAGQVVDSVAAFETFLQWLPPSCSLGLAADAGQMLAAAEIPLSDRLLRHRNRLALVTLSGGTGPPSCSFPHESTAGLGHWRDVAWDRLLAALDGSGFGGPAIVRVYGQAWRGLEPAVEAWQHLRGIRG